MERTLALIERLKDKHDRNRAGVAEALGSMGPAAKDAVPALIAALTAALHDENWKFRVSVVQALGEIGPAAKDASVPALIVALTDEDKTVRAYAFEALGRIGPEAKDAVPALAEALNGKDGAVQHEAPWRSA
jgi:HEAT repeat protein